MKSAALIINPYSRKASKLRSRLEEALEAHGIVIVRQLSFADSQTIEDFVNDLGTSIDCLIAAGGDGTLSSVAEVACHGKLPLGIVPLGTGNAFARDLRLPLDVEGAVETIATGRVQLVDVAFANKSAFLNVVTSGLSSAIVDALDNRQKRIWGWIAYLLALVRTSKTVKPFEITLTADGIVYKEFAWQLVVANGNWHGLGFQMHGDANVSDGYLHAYVVKSAAHRSKWHTLRSLWTGSQRQADEILALKAREFDIEFSRERIVNIDGEQVQTKSLQVRLDPACLSVIVPPN